MPFWQMAHTCVLLKLLISHRGNFEIFEMWRAGLLYRIVACYDSQPSFHLLAQCNYEFKTTGVAIMLRFQELHWYGATKYPARCAYRSVVLWLASVKIKPSFILIRFHYPYSQNHVIALMKCSTVHFKTRRHMDVPTHVKLLAKMCNQFRFCFKEIAFNINDLYIVSIHARLDSHIFNDTYKSPI